MAGTDLLVLQDGDGDLVSLGGVDETLQVSAGLLLRHPARLLGIVRLGLQLLLELRGDAQPRGRIRVGPVGLLDMAGHGGDTGESSKVTLKKLLQKRINCCEKQRKFNIYGLMSMIPLSKIDFTNAWRI